MSPACPVCSGTGDCPTCHGFAIVPAEDGLWQPCTACSGTGECPACVEIVDVAFSAPATPVKR
jgi:hypothetical protein